MLDGRVASSFVGAILIQRRAIDLERGGMQLAAHARTALATAVPHESQPRKSI